MSTIRADSLKDREGVGAPSAPNGMNVIGVCTATTFSGSGASLTSIPAANLTGALPAISGANLTGIDASQIVKWTYNVTNTGYSIANTNSWTDFTAWNVSITPASTSNRIMLICNTHLESRYNSTGGSGTVMEFMVSTDGGSSYSTANNGNSGSRGWNNLSNVRVGTVTSIIGIHQPANTNQHRFRLRGRTGVYTNTESWFGNNVDSNWRGSGVAIRTWVYAIEFKPNV